ncbi:MAG: cytochrome P450 [Verrucomicrobiae bacterium]|nr:cytochrome P450 [Verrucomicrobiae bacterium]
MLDLCRVDEFLAFAPYDPDYLETPYPVLKRLRVERPVFYDEQWRLTFFTRHTDIKAILKNRNQFGRDFRHRIPIEEVDADLVGRLYPTDAPFWVKYVREAFMDQEPPVHTRLRGLVSKAFTRQESVSWYPKLELLASNLLQDHLDGEVFDAIQAYASPIPVSLIAELMGIPGQDHERLIAWSARIVVPYDLHCSAEERALAEQATREFVAYLKTRIEERRRSPGTDLISSMLQVEENGDTLTEDEIIATAILTLNAGHEATVQALGNALLALANNPEQYGRLVDNPALVPNAVEELLRFDTPLQMFDRWVLEDCEVGGHALKRGQKVGVLLGSANHDEAIFAGDPEALDVSRDCREHLAFGAGLHHCVGSHLARIELQAALGVLVSKSKSLEVAGPLPPRKPSLVFRGLSGLPLRLTPK